MAATAAAPSTPATTCSMGVGIYQGNRELFPDDTRVLYYLYSGGYSGGRQLLFTKTDKPEVRFVDLPFQHAHTRWPGAPPKPVLLGWGCP